jgi:hypothetical protein
MRYAMMSPVSHPARRKIIVGIGPQISVAIGTSGIFVSGLRSAARADVKTKQKSREAHFLSRAL